MPKVVMFMGNVSVPNVTVATLKAGEKNLTNVKVDPLVPATLQSHGY